MPVVQVNCPRSPCYLITEVQTRDCKQLCSTVTSSCGAFKDAVYNSSLLVVSEMQVHEYIVEGESEGRVGQAQSLHDLLQITRIFREIASSMERMKFQCVSEDSKSDKRRKFN
jgi:phenylpyruvate tautomerase PptA (4-oxalocrotonate tautomerase family)